MSKKDFYVSFYIFHKIYAIKANKLLGVFNKKLYQSFFPAQLKKHILEFQGSQLMVINSFEMFENIQKVNQTDMILEIERPNDEKIGLPISAIRDLNLVSLNQIQTKKHGKLEKLFYCIEDESVEIIAEIE